MTESLKVLRQNGDALRKIDFGEIYCSPDKQCSKIVKFVNLTSGKLKVKITVPEAGESFPARLTLFPIDDDSMCDDALKEMVAEMPQEDIICDSNSDQNILIVLNPSITTWGCSDASGNSSTYHVQNSFHNISSSVTLEVEGVVLHEKITIPVSASMCTSVMYIDETDIEFDSCGIGNTYVRDIQVWNRSECRLLFRIVPFLNYDSSPYSGIESALSFSEFDTSRPVAFSKPLQIPAYASKRFRCTFKPKGKTEREINYNYLFENLNNGPNSIMLNCHIFVSDKEQSLAVTIENESGEIFGSGKSLDFGDCYTGLICSRNLYVKNNLSDRVVSVRLSSDREGELAIDLSGHVDVETLHSINLSGTLIPFSYATANAFTGNNEQSNPLFEGLMPTVSSSMSGNRYSALPPLPSILSETPTPNVAPPDHQDEEDDEEEDDDFHTNSSYHNHNHNLGHRKVGLGQSRNGRQKGSSVTSTSGGSNKQSTCEGESWSVKGFSSAITMGLVEYGNGYGEGAEGEDEMFVNHGRWPDPPTPNVHPSPSKVGHGGATWRGREAVGDEPARPPRGTKFGDVDAHLDQATLANGPTQSAPNCSNGVVRFDPATESKYQGAALTESGKRERLEALELRPGERKPISVQYCPCGAPGGRPKEVLAAWARHSFGFGNDATAAPGRFGRESFTGYRDSISNVHALGALAARSMKLFITWTERPLPYSTTGGQAKRSIKAFEGSAAGAGWAAESGAQSLVDGGPSAGAGIVGQLNIGRGMPGTRLVAESMGTEQSDRLGTSKAGHGFGGEQRSRSITCRAR